MAKDARKVLAELLAHLDTRRGEVTEDLQLMLEKHPEKVTGRVAARLSGQSRAYWEISDWIKDAINDRDS